MEVEAFNFSLRGRNIPDRAIQFFRDEGVKVFMADLYAYCKENKVPVTEEGLLKGTEVIKDFASGYDINPEEEEREIFFFWID